MHAWLRECKSRPPDRKPLPPHVLRDMSILLAIAVVWDEPLLSFGHDFKDFFNQLHCGS